jgi:mannose-6-phosphate isomerase-like protein (cupin superfamily)
MDMNRQPHFQALFEILRAFALNHTNPQLAPFKPALRDPGDSWRRVESAQLPVADLVADLVADTPQDYDPAARDLVQAFVDHNRQLHWEQSYRREDGLVPERMLDGYGFAEIIGLRGPLVSDRIRAGLAIWGPDIDYPQHRHQAQEAYILLAGSARFQFADSPPETRRAGDVVRVASNRPHGFRTQAECLLVCYLWQGGDLRQTSRFD